MKTIRFREYDGNASSSIAPVTCEAVDNTDFPNTVNSKTSAIGSENASTATKAANMNSARSDKPSLGHKEVNSQFRECIYHNSSNGSNDSNGSNGGNSNNGSHGSNVRNDSSSNSNKGSNNQNHNNEANSEKSKDKSAGGTVTRSKSGEEFPSLSWKTMHCGDHHENGSTESTTASNESLDKIKSVLAWKFRSQWQYDIKYKTQQFFRDLFLPIGYPNSVHEGYIQYQFYDSVQGLCSYLRGVVSTSAVLTAAGVGDAEATAMSAAVHWATKDGCGMIGGLLFSYYSSSYFDSHIKEFRLFADIINDIGLTLDMVAPYVPKAYLLYISISATICRSLCGIAAGATKGSITEHFSKHNMADLNAKEGTQETLVSLIGMVFGILLAQVIQSMEEQCHVLKGRSLYSYSAIFATWLIFTVLTLIHVWANYIGVKTLRLRSLNRQRAEEVLCHIIRKSSQLVKEDITKTKSDTIVLKMKLLEFNEEVTILPPSKCNESIWKSVEKMLFPGLLQLGVRLSDCLKHMSRKEIQSLIGNNLFRNEKYFLTINNQGLGSRMTKIDVVLHLGASEEDELKAFVHAMVVKDYIDGNCAPNDIDSRIRLITRSKNCVDILFHMKTLSLEKIVANGWDNKLLLGFGRWRATWSNYN